MVGLGEAKAADDLAGCELRQVFAALRLAAELEDGMHDQRGLHRHGGAIAGIDPLDLPRDQSIGDVAEPGSAVLFRDRRAEKAQRSHFLHDGGIEALLAIVEEDAGKQLVLGIAARGVAHHAFFRGELAFEVERIVPVEVGLGAGRLRPLLELLGGLRHGRTPGLLLRFGFMRTFIDAIQGVYLGWNTAGMSLAAITVTQRRSALWLAPIGPCRIGRPAFALNFQSVAPAAQRVDFLRVNSMAIFDQCTRLR